MSFTVSGTVGNQAVNFLVESRIAQTIAQTIVDAAGNNNITGSATTSSQYFVATNPGPALITSGTTIASGDLDGLDTTFNVGSNTQVAVIATADQFNGSSYYSLNNFNPTAEMVAFTGLGNNNIDGEGLINAAQTVGTDSVKFVDNGQPVQINVLNSAGQDTVSIYGPTNPDQIQQNVLVTGQSGTQLTTLNNGADLSFMNLSTGVSTITATAGSTVSIFGTGNTSVTGGAGQEVFNVAASSGNVSISGGSGTDTFDFIKAQAGNSTSQHVVSNFTSADTVNLSGYGTTDAYTAQVVNGSTVLTLSDKTTITFTGVQDASSVTSHIKTS